MQKTLIGFLGCILVLVWSTSFARDKQPRRYSVDSSEETVTQASSAPNTSRRNMSADERLSRLERLINSQGLVDLLLRLEALQKEVQQLRGDIETQTYITNDLKKRQRDLYIDIDRRLLKIERNTAGQVTSNVTPQYKSQYNSSSVTPSTSNKIVPSSANSALATQTKPIKQNRTVSTRPVSKPVDPIKEQNAYQKAFDLLRELRYDQAIKAYRQFIIDYPNGRYAHIAQYWLSEASYAQRHFKQAITDYQNLVNNYPNSPKLAEALLKIGYSYNELGQNKEAQETIEKLLRLYPNTTAAGQGQNLLKKIKSSRR